jgi:hypothetical protein
MDAHLKAELTAREKWLRLLYIVGYALMFQVAEVVLVVLVVVQFLIVLFTGARNINLTDFAGQLGEWLRQSVAFMTWVDDERPWPFGRAWPASADSGGDAGD